jgi:hypothetical protein
MIVEVDLNGMAGKMEEESIPKLQKSNNKINKINKTKE